YPADLDRHSFPTRRSSDLFKAAKESGKYEKVLYFNGQTKRHYALNNDQEYFAESTEAYFGTNDFYPFVRPELKEFDPQMYEVIRSEEHTSELQSLRHLVCR